MSVAKELCKGTQPGITEQNNVTIEDRVAQFRVMSRPAACVRRVRLHAAPFVVCRPNRPITDRSYLRMGNCHRYQPWWPTV